MESIIYNQEGKATGKADLPSDIFGVPFNADLVHEVAQSMLSSRRSGTAHTKNRGEVRGGGKKPWRQKGTGRARHGSIRSPIWVGGGVAHGPRNEKNYERKINKRARVKALRSVLSAKMRDGEILLIDNLVIPEIKTKEAKSILSKISKIDGFGPLSAKRENSALLLLPEKNRALELSFRNMGNVMVAEARNLNILDALKFKYLVIINPLEAVKQMAKDNLQQPALIS